MITRYRSVFLAFIVLGATLLAGCGGGTVSGGDTSASPATASGPVPPNYAKQAVAVCSKTGAKILAVLTSPPKQAGGTEAQTFETLNRTVFVPAVEQELGELRQLEMPEGHEATIEAVLTTLEQGAEGAAAGSVTSIEDFGKFFVQFDRQADRAGLAECAFSFA